MSIRTQVLGFVDVMMRVPPIIVIDEILKIGMGLPTQLKTGTECLCRWLPIRSSCWTHVDSSFGRNWMTICTMFAPLAIPSSSASASCCSLMAPGSWSLNRDGANAGAPRRSPERAAEVNADHLPTSSSAAAAIANIDNAIANLTNEANATIAAEARAAVSSSSSSTSNSTNVSYITASGQPTPSTATSAAAVATAAASNTTHLFRLSQEQQ
ncbi:GH18695 [Drosophila grimshawi]|uniref:GH18695 n=1 Tax=Drosophila grimshawi TaxID=7222 RepID=B4JGT3_DROGR|nr:GH18695 [Drosophila grimshawi]